MILTVLFYLLMEWLFFATKPSFLSTLSLIEKLSVLILSSTLPVAGASLIFLSLQLAGRIVTNQHYRKFWIWIIGCLPAFVLASSWLLLIDNFTLTVADFGIRSFLGIERVCYTILFCVLFVLAYRKVFQWERWIHRRFSPRTLTLGIGIASLLWMIAALSAYASFGYSVRRNGDKHSDLARSPNILLIGSDGINAENMSLYGYHRDTTPYLRRFANDALVCKKTFTNASTSLGSLTSMLTGKLPIETRLICVPDILKGKDAYQHLPGILRNHGYRSIQLTARNLSDAYDANMRAGFDQVNFRTAREQLTLEKMTPFVGQEAAYFLQQTYERLADRLLHIFGLSTMLDPFLEVTDPTRQGYTDARRLKELKRFIKSSDKPFFAHIHLMKTHRLRFFKEGMENPTSFMNDRYDDAIQKFDRVLKRMMETLTRTNILEKTIVIVYSDHGWRHSTDDPVPLIIRFPNGKYRGTIEGFAQLQDIAPTVLDYMGIPKKPWMSGQSLISEEPDGCRWIISAQPISAFDTGPKMVARSQASEPFFTLGTINVATCGTFFKYKLQNKLLTTAPLNDKENCNECKVPSASEVKSFIADRLKQNGYDTSSLR